MDSSINLVVSLSWEAVMAIAHGKGSININSVVKTMSPETGCLGSNHGPITCLLPELAVLLFLHLGKKKSQSIKLIYHEVYSSICYYLSFLFPRHLTNNISYNACKMLVVIVFII